MTKTQILEYEYCNKHLLLIPEWKNKLPFGIQKYGCGSGTPNIEHSLEKIHQDMYTSVFKAIQRAEEQIQNIVNNI